MVTPATALNQANLLLCFNRPHKPQPRKVRVRSGHPGADRNASSFSPKKNEEPLKCMIPDSVLAAKTTLFPTLALGETYMSAPGEAGISTTPLNTSALRSRLSRHHTESAASVEEI